MAFRRPNAGESYEDYRAAMKAASANGGVEPATGFEAAKAKVAAQQKAREVANAPAKQGIKLDNAAAEADEIERRADVRKHGGIQPLDTAAIAAADKDLGKRIKEVGANAVEEERLGMAKAVRAERKPAGVAHSTSTPGSAPQTSMGAALSKAGMSTQEMQDKLHHDSSQDIASTGKVDAGPLPNSVNKQLDAATLARNNGGGRGTSGGDSAAAASAVAGVTIPASEAAAARGRATQGTRKNGGVKERTPGGRITKPAPAAAPQAATPSQGVFGSQLHAKAFAATFGQSGPSTPLSAKPVAAQAPVSNPAPMAPAPASNPTPAAPNTPTAPPASSTTVEPHAVGAGSHHRFDKETGQGRLFGVSGMRKGNRVSERMGEIPEHDYTAAPGRNQPAMITEKGRISPNAKAPDGGQKPRSAAQKPAALSEEAAQPVASPGAVAHISKQQVAQTGPSPVAERMDTAPRPTPVATPAVSAEAPRRAGRSIEAPRGGEMGGGRMARPAGGIHVTGDNNSNIGNTTIHNNYNYTVHGDVNGHIGNNEGGRGSGPGSAGGHGGSRIAGGRAPRESAGAKPDLWVKDVNGRHSLREGIEHVTGQTGGRGERLKMGKASTGGSSGTFAGGSQRPMAGSPRSAANGAQMAAPSATPGTGSTNNWQGPASGVNLPKSGIGTSGYTATKPNPKLVENP